MPNAFAADQARLRLAARTLIEWKVPVSSQQYRTVLRDLLESHPAAQSWGLRIDSKLFDYDDQGIILWYLSETLTEDNRQIPSETKDESSVIEMASAGALTEFCFKRLIRYGTGADADKQVWASGPTKSTIVERVLEVFEDPVDSSMASAIFLSSYHVLISMLLDDGDPVKQEILNRFWRLSKQKPLRSTRIRSLALLIKNSSTFLSILSVAFGFLGLGKALREVSVRINDFVFGNSQSSGLVTTILFLLVIGIASVSIGRQTYKRLRTIYADVIAALKSRTSSGYFDRFLSRPFQRLIGFICTTNIALFQRLVSGADGSVPNAWETCMHRTKMVTGESARILLSMMVRTDLDELTKATLFRWLCSVNIKNKQSIYTNFTRQAKYAIDHYNKRLSRNRHRLSKKKRRKTIRA